MDGVLIELDDRRRATLGKLASHDRYLARELPDGAVFLEPAVVLTVTELRVNSNRKVVEQIVEAIEKPETRVRRGRPQRRG